MLVGEPEGMNPKGRAVWRGQVEGPVNEFRAVVADRLNEVTAETPDEQAEAVLDGVLQEIAHQADADVANGWDQDPVDLLAAVESWASVASYAVARVYAPNSPWRRLAGFSRHIAAHLTSLRKILFAPLEAAARALGASSFSIGASFPWAGVSVSLTWQ